MRDTRYKVRKQKQETKKNKQETKNNKRTRTQHDSTASSHKNKPGHHHNNTHSSSSSSNDNNNHNHNHIGNDNETNGKPKTTPVTQACLGYSSSPTHECLSTSVGHVTSRSASPTHTSRRAEPTWCGLEHASQQLVRSGSLGFCLLTCTCAPCCAHVDKLTKACHAHNVFDRPCRQAKPMPRSLHQGA